MANLGFVLGGIVAISVLMFIWRFMLRRVIADPYLLVFASTIAALLTATLLGAFGLADGGPPKFVAAFFGYALPAGVVGFVALAITYTRDGAAK